MQQRRLARARFANQRQPLSRRHFEVHVIQNDQIAGARAVALS